MLDSTSYRLKYNSHSEAFSDHLKLFHSNDSESIRLKTDNLPQLHYLVSSTLKIFIKTKKNPNYLIKTKRIKIFFCYHIYLGIKIRIFSAFHLLPLACVRCQLSVQTKGQKESELCVGILLSTENQIKQKTAFNDRTSAFKDRLVVCLTVVYSQTRLAFWQTSSHQQDVSFSTSFQ